MVLDIDLFREYKGGNPEIVRESQRRRYKDPNTVDELLILDTAVREAQHSHDETRMKAKEIQKLITVKKKAGEPCDDLIAQKTELDRKTAEFKALWADADAKVFDVLNRFGNIVHASVPVSNDEDKDNEIVAVWGKRRVEPNLRFHHELLYMIDGADYERGANVAGQRGYFLKGVGVQLNYALINYAMEFLTRDTNRYTLIQTPFFMKKEVMAKTAQLEEFDEALYKVSGSREGDEKYLIATSEQPISAMHMDEWMDPNQMPIRYAGVSTCFRKESGKDVWGIFRVHQFEKVEQFCITAPAKSWEEHEKMRTISEEFHQSLGIPYRVVVIVSGELNNAAAKKYDIEGWFPGNTDGVRGTTGHAIPATYRELVSCSNCTDYQSRSLNIRYGTTVKANGTQSESGKQYVHMLNSTLTATGRGICAILENHQTDKGINIPEPLQKYMGGKTFIPFVHSSMPIGKGAKGVMKQAVY